MKTAVESYNIKPEDLRGDTLARPEESGHRIYMIARGKASDSRAPFSVLVNEQAASLRTKGLEIYFGIVGPPVSISGMLRNLLKMRSEIKGIKPDVIHAQYGSVIALAASLIKGKVPLVVSFCGSDLLGVPVPGLNWRIREWLARLMGLWAAHFADVIIVKSSNILQRLPSYLQRRAHILPNGVDTDFFIPMDKDICRAMLGWRRDAKIILFHSGVDRSRDISDIKNVKLAEAVFRAVEDRMPGVELFQFSKLTRETIRTMMCASDCLLVTSLHEGSPNVVKEAMACNLPVVSVLCGDVAERLRGVYPGGTYGYDEGSLAEGIMKVFEASQRSNGRLELMSQGLTAPDVAASLSGIYRKVVVK
ncbi:MAG: glycosyltransferase [Nitrospirae bacterium]|nr:glycosyltransferase [Nitrospirota bacterium]